MFYKISLQNNKENNFRKYKISLSLKILADFSTLCESESNPVQLTK